MTMVVGDIIEVKAFQTYLSQQLLNVFHYIVMEQEESSDLDSVATAFNGFWTTSMAPLLMNTCVLNLIEVKNLTDGISIYSLPASVPGEGELDGAPSFTCYSFRFNRATAITRHGQKRFSGVPEAYITNGTVVPAISSLISNAAGDMATGLSSQSGVNDFILTPVIIGRTLQPDGTYALDLTKVNDVLNVQYIRISTQNTRKPGRGS